MSGLKTTLLRALSISVFSLAIAACSGGGSESTTAPPSSGGGSGTGGGGGGTGGGGSGTTPPPSAGIDTPTEITIFESGQVRPLALSADGNQLYAVNTPDNRLEVFDLNSGSPVLSNSIPVGMEPVSVAVDSSGRAWVVNHLSDSISVVDTSTGVVTRTLYVGDEPRDIVFASGKAFITTAHRGQNAPFNPQLTTAGVGRADVWVFDENALGAAMGGLRSRLPICMPTHLEL